VTRQLFEKFPVIVRIGAARTGPACRVNARLTVERGDFQAGIVRQDPAFQLKGNRAGLLDSIFLKRRPVFDDFGHAGKIGYRHDGDGKILENIPYLPQFMLVA
jgi:hypothetical protein